eukprot:10221443-Prorocentrum_lima.AAC.1
MKHFLFKWKHILTRVIGEKVQPATTGTRTLTSRQPDMKTFANLCIHAFIPTTKGSLTTSSNYA